MVTWEEQKPICVTNKNGAIGIDINPDGLALVEVDKHGNLLHHHYEKSDRLAYGNNCQRLQDIREIANRVIKYALGNGKQIVIEDLKFTQKKKYKKFNRMSHNFIYRKLSEAIERKAYLSGVKLIKVNPAFTECSRRKPLDSSMGMNPSCFPHLDNIIHNLEPISSFFQKKGQLYLSLYNTKLSGKAHKL